MPPNLDRKQRWLWSATRIRCALAPNEPRLIPYYLDEGLALVRGAELSAWDAARQSAELLVRTAADRVLPGHWRHLCLDHVHLPIARMSCCAVSQRQQAQLAAIRWRVATLDLSSSTSLDGPDSPLA